MGSPTGKDEFLIGWLDAIWSGFSKADHVDAPEDVRKLLIRKGWLAPRSREDGGGVRKAAVTPLGMQVVIGASQRHGIHRTIEDLDGNSYTPEVTEWPHEKKIGSEQ